MPVVSLGVDWAVYQAGGDADLLRRQGGDFLIAKASQDWGTDSGFATHIQNAKRAAIIPGAYHFLIEPGCGANVGYNNGNGGTSLEAQARTFVRVVKEVNGGTLDGILCCVDLENLNRTGLGAPSGTTYKIKSHVKAYHARGFAKEFHKLAPRQPLFVYTAYSFLTGTDMREWSQPMRLWIAYWTVNTENYINSGVTGIPESRWTTRYGGLMPTIVQYQSGGHGGRAGNEWSDLDASNLEPKQLKRLARPVIGPDPDPDPDPDPEPKPLEFTDVTSIEETLTAVTIVAHTTLTAKSLVEYGTTKAYGTITPQSAVASRLHKKRLTGLVEDTTYHYRVKATRGVAVTYSGDGTFKTTKTPKPDPKPDPDPDPWPEPWLDPTTGKVDPARVAVTTAGAGGIIGAGAMLLVAVAVFGVWKLSKTKASIFADKDD